MKLFRVLIRSIQDAFKSVFRNFSLSLASISCITITLIIVAIAIVASFNVENFTKLIEKDMTIVAFVSKDATTEEVEKLKKDIDSNKNVASYVFKDKAVIKEDMQKESETFKTILSQWKDEESPLKSAFQVKVKDVKKIGKTAETIENMDKIDLVRYGEGMVEKMVKTFESVEKVAYGAVIALVLVTIFLIVNTIKLTIFSRKREISIMRLVGASNFTIKTPFIIEGMVLGLLGSIIPILFTTFGYISFYDHFDGHLYSELIRLIKPEPFIYTVSLIVLVIGIIVGMIGSARAVRKYLKV
ncbi:MAG: permease-like cell division protein FtsX [Bacilli bacterium]|nr:permease-like cell division protein FtsX [Bacilli bacterium]